jgi:hypothetical protein
MTEDADAPRERETEPPETGHRADGSEDGTADEPLGDLARRVRERREGGDDADDADTFGSLDGATEDADLGERSGDGDSGGVGDVGDVGTDRESGDLFEEMDVSDVDTDAVWASVLEDDPDDPDGPGDAEEDTPGVDVGTAAAADVESTVDDDHIVPKDDYCESCHFFGDPPTVECSYEGADVVEVVDMEQFRVRNCPVVSGLVDTDGAVFERGDEGDVRESPSD